MKYVFLFFILQSSSYATARSLKNFLKQYPNVSSESTVSFDLKTSKTTLVAVLRCFDDKEKELSSCKINSPFKQIENWSYDFYIYKNKKFEFLQKSDQLIGYDLSIYEKRGIIYLKSNFHFGSTTVTESKYRLEAGKLKLIGIEYHIAYGGQPERYENKNRLTSSDFSINILTDKFERTDNYVGGKTEKSSCPFNQKFKNFTISDSIFIPVDDDNFSCD